MLRNYISIPIITGLNYSISFNQIFQPYTILFQYIYIPIIKELQFLNFRNYYVSCRSLTFARIVALLGMLYKNILKYESHMSLKVSSLKYSIKYQNSLIWFLVFDRGCKNIGCT
jgi:hypothetical protein